MRSYKRAMAVIICICVVAGAATVGFSLWKNNRERNILITYAPPTSVSSPEENMFPININEASLEELELIPEIGPKKAASIIEYRETNGNFQRIEDITNVSGIGEKTFEKLRDYICV